jgi:hypothetical protein
MREVFTGAAEAPQDQAAGSKEARRLSRQLLFDDHILERRSRLVDHEIGRLLRGQPAGLDTRKCRVDYPVEVAESWVIGQEFGDL